MSLQKLKLKYRQNMSTSDNQASTRPLLSLAEPLDSERLFTYLRDVSRKLARDVDRVSSELPKSEEQVRLAASKITQAQVGIEALAQHAKKLNDIWERSEQLAKTVGEAAGKASVKSIDDAVADLNKKLQASVDAASDAAGRLERTMRFSKAPWIAATVVSFALTILAAVLTYEYFKPSDRDAELKLYGTRLERMFQRADAKEKAVLGKLYNASI